MDLTDLINERFLARTYRLAGVVTVVGTLGLLAGVGRASAMNFSLGALCSLLILWSLDVLVRRLMTVDKAVRPTRRRFVMLTLLKYPVLMGILYLVVRAPWFHPIWLTLGFGVMPGSIMAQVGISMLTMNVSKIGDVR